MFKASLLIAAVIALGGVASAGGQPGSIGVGAEYQLSGIGGLSIQYDGGMFHAGALLGIRDPDGAPATYDVGGDFWFHVHHTAFTDFSVGGNLGLESVTANMGVNPPRRTDVYLEPGFQIRAFLSSNVAISATGGISLGLGDDKTIVLAGQGFGLGGAIGIHYYFY